MKKGTKPGSGGAIYQSVYKDLGKKFARFYGRKPPTKRELKDSE